MKKSTVNFLEDIDPKDDATHVERAIQLAMFPGRAGQVIPWKNPHNDHRGEIKLEERFENSKGSSCWKYTRTLTQEDQFTNFAGSVCNNQENNDAGMQDNWTVVEETQKSKTAIAKVSPPPTVPAKPAESPAPAPALNKAKPVPNQEVRETQERLAQLGFNPGPADGLYGKGTRRAIEEYQKTRGVVADGRVSPILIAKLRAEMAAVAKTPPPRGKPTVAAISLALEAKKMPAVAKPPAAGPSAQPRSRYCVSAGKKFTKRSARFGAVEGLSAPFADACEQHDSCYVTAAGRILRSMEKKYGTRVAANGLPAGQKSEAADLFFVEKLDCDQKFLADVKRRCQANFPPSSAEKGAPGPAAASCTRVSAAYYATVTSAWGDAAFDGAVTRALVASRSAPPTNTLLSAVSTVSPPASPAGTAAKLDKKTSMAQPPAGAPIPAKAAMMKPARVSLAATPPRHSTESTRSPVRSPQASPANTNFSNASGVAVIIGNKRYSHERVPEVSYAHRDAEAFKRYVIDVLKYDPDNIIDLRDATQAQMLSTFGNSQSFQGKLWSYLDPSEKSDVVIYYSGHGVPGQKSGRGYLLPADASPDSAEINGYPIDLLYANLGKLKGTRSVQVFLDACFSGDSPKGALVQSASPVFVKAALPKTEGELTVLTAASGSQLASWDDTAKHGLFTQHLMDALYGKADRNGDGEVTAGEVKAYLDRYLTRAARRNYGRIQQASLNGSASASISRAVGGSFPQRPTKLVLASPVASKKRTAPRPVIPEIATQQPHIPEGLLVENALGMTSDDRIRIQLALNAMGLDAGPSDGLFGSKTRSAIKMWQGAKGFLRTGYLTSPQSAALIRIGKRLQARNRLAIPHQQHQQQPANASPGALILKGFLGAIGNSMNKAN